MRSSTSSSRGKTLRAVSSAGSSRGVRFATSGGSAAGMHATRGAQAASVTQRRAAPSRRAAAPPFIARLRALPANLSGGLSVTLLAIASVLGIMLALYAPTRDWYVAMRQGQDLEARYNAITADNDTLADDVARLQTREGIEDEARRRGYVAEGETGVIVENLPDDLSDASAPSTTTTPTEDTRGLGVRLLDLVFGYEAAS